MKPFSINHLFGKTEYFIDKTTRTDPECNRFLSDIRKCIFKNMQIIDKIKDEMKKFEDEVQNEHLKNFEEKLERLIDQGCVNSGFSLCRFKFHSTTSNL